MFILITNELVGYGICLLSYLVPIFGEVAGSMLPANLALTSAHLVNNI